MLSFEEIKNFYEKCVGINDPETLHKVSKEGYRVMTAVSIIFVQFDALVLIIPNLFEERRLRVEQEELLVLLCQLSSGQIHIWTRKVHLWYF